MQTALRGRCLISHPMHRRCFWPMPGLNSNAGVTGSVGHTHHAHDTRMAGLSSSWLQGCLTTHFVVCTVKPPVLPLPSSLPPAGLWCGACESS